MMVISAETTVRDIVVEEPTAIPVLEKFGIDYCCGGKHSLAEACSARHQNVGSVIEELERQMGETNEAEVEWQTAPLKDLIDHIVRKHHAFTREQLVLISKLANKVEHRHRTKHPEVSRVSRAFANINAGLMHHFDCEEKVLFPYIEQLAEQRKAQLPVQITDIQQPISRMMKDHDQAGDELRVLREITNDYYLPDDACTPYRALYQAIQDLERDLHRHIHLENNILFPRALRVEREG
jgi:regulator of cell morphogenesis and NO signaling